MTIKRLNIIDYIHNESSPNHCLHIDNERSPNHWLYIDNKTFSNNFLHRQRNVPKSLTMHKQLNVSELLNINYTTELFKSVLLKISLTQLSWLNIQFASIINAPIKNLNFFYPITDQLSDQMLLYINIRFLAKLRRSQTRLIIWWMVSGRHNHFCTIS